MFAEFASPGIEPKDDRQRLALGFVTDVVREMELECTVVLRASAEESPDEINIEIEGRDAGLAIGKKGQVLQALQFLTHRVEVLINGVALPAGSFEVEPSEP